jgi:DNA replication protein DnaC
MSDTEPRPVSAGLSDLRRRLAEMKGGTYDPSVWSWDGPHDDEEIKAHLMEMRKEAAIARWAQLIPPRFQGAKLGEFSPKMVDQITGWQEISGEGKNLVIFGPVGVGKSRAACAAVRKACAAGPILFRPSGEMLNDLRPGGAPGAFDALASVPMLIVDDLGVEKVTDWTTEQIDLLINRRWLDEKPTVITTNLEPADLSAHVGERAYSRLVGEGAVVLRLTGADRRRS